MIINKLLSPQFIRYSIIGFSGVFLDYLLFGLLTQYFEMNYQWANVISTSAGIINNFLANAFLNFKVRDRLLSRFFRFYCVGLLGMAVTALLLYILVGQLHLNAMISKAGTIFIIVILQYTLNKKFSFSKKA